MISLKNMSLLYVEDNEETLALYKNYLELYFSNVYIAKNGKEALDIYYRNNPDVILLDIDIPDINGINVAKRIREFDDETSIIMLTALSDKKTFLDIVELGLTAFLEKPVSRKQLLDAFNKVKSNQKKIIYKKANVCYIWNFFNRTLECNGEVVHLTKNERKLFSLFLNNLKRDISYEEIFEELYFYNGKEISIPAIKTLIRGLRLKLPKNMIVNVYGIGYRLEICS